MLYGFMLLVFTDVMLTAHITGNWLPAVVVTLFCLSVFELPLILMGGKCTCLIHFTRFIRDLFMFTTVCSSYYV